MSYKKAIKTSGTLVVEGTETGAHAIETAGLAPYQVHSFAIARGPKGVATIEPAARIQPVGAGFISVRENVAGDTCLHIGRILSVGADSSYKAVAIELSEDERLKLAVELLDSLSAPYVAEEITAADWGLRKSTRADKRAQAIDQERRRVNVYNNVLDHLRKRTGGIQKGAAIGSAMAFSGLSREQVETINKEDS